MRALIRVPTIPGDVAGPCVRQPGLPTPVPIVVPPVPTLHGDPTAQAAMNKTQSDLLILQQQDKAAAAAAAGACHDQITKLQGRDG